MAAVEQTKAEPSIGFIGWCDLILNKLIEASETSAWNKSYGVDEILLAQILFGEEIRTQEGFHQSKRRRGMLDAVDELIKVGLVEQRDESRFWRVTVEGHDLAQNKGPLWEGICRVKLAEDEEKILLAVNKLSPHVADDHAWLDQVHHESLLPELGWTDVLNELWPISERLESRGLVWRKAVPGPHLNLKSTYAGIVWETMRSPLGEAEMAHVLFLDIVGYSKLPMEQQAQSLQQLQEGVRNTPEFHRAQVVGNQLISLPTGDGMALVFFRGLIPHVQCALELSQALRRYPDLKLRMGAHSGPVYRVVDINTNMNVAGGGINIAQRVMECGDAGHILLSKAVADVLIQLGGWEDRLQDLGEAEVKHGVIVHVYSLYDGESGNPQLPGKLEQGAPANARVSTPSLLDPVIKYHVLLDTNQRDFYQLQVALHNTGPTPVDDYEVEVEFPAAFIESEAILPSEVDEKRTPTHRIFRSTHSDHGNRPLHPDSTRTMLTIDYFIDHFKIRDVRTSPEMRETVLVTVKSGDFSPRTVEKELIELVNV